MRVREPAHGNTNQCVEPDCDALPDGSNHGNRDARCHGDRDAKTIVSLWFQPTIEGASSLDVPFSCNSRRQMPG